MIKKLMCLTASLFVVISAYASVIQCPDSSALSNIKQVGWFYPSFTVDNLNNDWDIKISSNQFAPLDEILAGMPKTASLTIRVTSDSDKQTCIYLPSCRDWIITLRSKQAINYSDFNQFHNFRSEPLYNGSHEYVTGDQRTCVTQANNPKECYQ